MTLLFYLRSPAGSTDTGQSPDTGRRWNYDDAETIRKKRDKQLEREERKVKRIAKQKWDKAFKDVADKKRKRKKEEELLIMLFMHEFDGYDD